jgi:hypothetical protein
MKLFSTTVALLFFTSLIAQTNTLDPQLVNVNQSSVTSGIIYERVTQIANLYDFNQSGNVHNTANYAFFEQALSELYRASNNTRLISHYELWNRILADESSKNVVNIGIINSPFQILNYDPDTPSLGGLNLVNNLYSQISNTVPFYDLYALVVAPLKSIAEGTSITYKFRNDLILNNGNKTIKTLIADLGDGIARTIISNGTIVLPSVTYNNTGSNGDKKLSFTVTFDDNFTITTYGKISLFKSAGRSLTGRGTANTSSALCVSSPTVEDLLWNNPTNPKRLISDYAYQGLGESTPIFGEIEARVFYKDNQRKLSKPILIIDGFDPGDARKIQDCDCQDDADCFKNNSVNGVFKAIDYDSFQDVMGYKNESDIVTNFIETANTKGFDVILINLPTYYRNGVKIDGGADYIERNAMNLATLINKLNLILIQNGSTEKLVVIGPSMGGQISRYALAWMEKKFAETNDPKYKHNTRLWVAFDSPNLGANIPMGDQALINLVKSESRDAEKKYNELLGSTASKEQLIEFHQQGTSQNLVNTSYLNGSTISQGMPTNSGNPYFQTHYNNQFTNGLPNSKGFPMNLRKIAIVNGSLTGKTSGSNDEVVLDLKAIQRVCYKPLSFFGIGGGPSHCYTTVVSQMDARYLTSSGGSSAKIAYFRKAPSSGIYTESPNLNTRGNMDIVPGGLYGATNDISEAITGKKIFETRGSFWQYPGDNIGYWLSKNLGTADWDIRKLKPLHTFIPTFSSIAHKQPNQSWANPLNRNLVCTGETPFDSYFGEDENTEHVTLNYRSVNWLLKELGDSTTLPSWQPPSFPISSTTNTGEDRICYEGDTSTYNLDPCKVPGPATWSVSSNLAIVSQTAYSVTVSNLSPGTGTIKSTFKNGLTTSRAVALGSSAPSPYFPTLVGGYTCAFDPGKYAPCVIQDAPHDSGRLYSSLSLTAAGIGNTIDSDWEWEAMNEGFKFSGSTTSPDGKKATGKDFVTISFTSYIPDFIQFRCRVKNVCTWGDWKSYIFKFSDGRPIVVTPPTPTPPASGYYTFNPNPTMGDTITISLIDENIVPPINTTIVVSVWTTSGTLVLPERNLDSSTGGSLYVGNLLYRTGYLLRIKVNNVTETHYLIKS